MANLYLITQSQRVGMDTFDSAVVCAASKKDARTIHPRGDEEDSPWWSSVWCESPSYVKVTEIGTANANQVRGVICASYNGG